MGRGPLAPGQPRRGLAGAEREQSVAGYLPEHDDVEADAVGLDECAVLGASWVVVVLGEPEERRTRYRDRHRPA